MNSYKSVKTLKSDILFKYGYLFSPYKKEFKKDEAIQTQFTTTNPLRPDMMVLATENINIDSFNILEDAVFFNIRNEYDLDEYNKALIELMVQAKELMKELEEEKKVGKEIMEAPNVTLKNQIRIKFNTKTTWAEQAISEILVEFSESEKSVPSNKIVKSYRIE